MDLYPPDYVTHNLPLVILTGLDSEVAETPSIERSQAFLGDGGFRVRADLPPLHQPVAQQIQAALLAHDKTNAPWRSPSTDKSSDQNRALKIKSVARNLVFPPRKAPPPPHSPRLNNENGLAAPPPLILHSTISPLSPSSPLYPDGILSSLWITKHQHRLPAVLVTFYNLVSDLGSSSLEDNKIKNEVNSIRGLISSTNYKTRFVIVLVADGPIAATELEERLVNIRRGTNFDSKALYFLPSSSTPTEIRDFAAALLANIYPSAIEHYRDLSKHARRKRNRNAVPQPTVPPTQGTSSILSLQGWNVRYEFKLGVFAEARHEFEAASSSYQQAYEGLFNAELLGEAIPSWTARFNEARILADVIAMRIIRCYLWSAQTTNAVRWWTNHRDRIQNLVDRRGKGLDNYGWHAWQATWARLMSELIQRSECFMVAGSQLSADSPLPIIVPSDGSAGAERQPPIFNLHHEGYWLAMVRKHIVERREKALQIPEDISPSNALTRSRTETYDTYLCPEPVIERKLLGGGGESYARRIEATIDEAIDAFSARDQTRMIQALRYLRLKEDSSTVSNSTITTLYQSLWQSSSWRGQGWRILLVEAGKLLFEQAEQHEEYEIALSLALELHALQQGDVATSLNLPAITAAINLQDVASVLDVSFMFAAGEGNVGELLTSQLVIDSPHGLPFGFEIEEVRVTFDGGIGSLLLRHESTTSVSDSEGGIGEVDLVEEQPSNNASKRLSLSGPNYWSGVSDLTLTNNSRRIINTRLIPYEAGMVTVSSLTLHLTSGESSLNLITNDLSRDPGIWWELKNGVAKPREFGMRRDIASVNVLPRPPKLDIQIMNLSRAYYTNENVSLQIQLLNNEENDLQGEFHVRLITPSDKVTMAWEGDTPITVTGDEVKEVALSSKNIEELSSGSSLTHLIHLSGLFESVDHELELKVQYCVGNTSETVTKQIMVDIPVIRPFEASATFSPRIHEESWPNFFDYPAASTSALGLKNQFFVKAEIGCFAQEPIILKAVQLVTKRIIGGAECRASSARLGSSKEAIPEEGVEILPDKISSLCFDLEMQKTILGDRAPVNVDFAIDVEWSRKGFEAINTSTLLLPRFLAPMSEPRVLLRVSRLESGNFRLIYTIENSSMHFLTFNVQMEASESFAWSGPKSKTLSLTPISRVDVDYQLYLQKQTMEWLKVPELTVLDAFFVQTLKIQPASEFLRLDKQGSIQLLVG